MPIVELISRIIGMFFHARPEGWIVILAGVLPIALFALQRLRRASYQLRAEELALEHCRGALRTLRNEHSDVEEEHIRAWLRVVPRQGIVSRIISSLWSMRVQANPDMEAVASMLDVGEVARLGFARSAPNYLLLAGLFGTVLGLAGAVSSLGPQIQGTLLAKDPLTLTASLAVTLQHMQNAFSCTLWGIAGALLIGGIGGRLSNRQASFLAQVQEFGIVELAPAILPRAQAVQLEDVRLVLKDSQAFLRSITEMMGKAAQDFQEALSDAGTAMRGSIEQLSDVAGGMQQALVTVAGDVRQSAEALQRSTEAVQQSAESLKEYHTHLRNAYVEIQNLFEQGQTQIEMRADAQLNEIRQLQQQFSASAEGIIAHVDTSSERLTEAGAAFAAAGGRVLTAGDQINRNVDQHFHDLAESMRTLIEEHQQKMALTEEGLRGIASSMNELSLRLDPRMLPRGEWERVVTSLDMLCSSLDGERKASSGWKGAQTADSEMRGDWPSIWQSSSDPSEAGIGRKGGGLDGSSLPPEPDIFDPSMESRSVLTRMIIGIRRFLGR